MRKEARKAASKKFEKGSLEWNLFRDYWEICKQFWVPESSDDYRASLGRAIEDFRRKYGDNHFAKKIALAFDEVSRKEQGKNRSKEELERGFAGWNLFQNFYKLCQEFWIPEESGDYWTMLIAATEEFNSKYKDISLTRELILAFVDAKTKEGDYT